MKRTAVVMITAFAFATMPELVDDPSQRKNECLLLAKRCSTSVQSVQDKIEKLREEIDKGERVYSPQEMELLQQKLEEVEKVLDFLGHQSPYIDDDR